jgi:ribosomal protein S18 acetylase RimI-like enzyme
MSIRRNPIQIRSATQNDLNAIVDFNTRLAHETEGKSLDCTTLTEGVRAALNDERKARYFVADTDGMPVGMLMVTYEWSDWRNGQIWWIQSVYVTPKWRRRGVFRALYQHIHELAKANGAVGLRLYVERNNTIAQKTYQQMGMEDAHYFVLEKIPLDV